MQDKNFFTPFLEILQALAPAFQNPGYVAGWAVIILAGFCFLVLTGGDDS